MKPPRQDFESASAAAIAADPDFAALFDGAKTPHPVTGLDDAPVLYNDSDRLAFAALAHELVAEIAAGRPVRIFFDNDGTLFRFNPDPAATKMDDACFEGLVRLSRFPNVLATSLTGRGAREAAAHMLAPGYDVRDSRGMLLSPQGDKTLRFSITGSHGIEHLDRDGTLTRHDFGPAASDFIRRFQADAARLRVLYPGITVEDNKHGAVGINVRTVTGPESAQAEAYAVAEALLAAYESAPDNPVLENGRRLFALRREGTRELELRPAGLGKDFGIRRFGGLGGGVEQGRDTLTLFMGDSFKEPDGTDLDAARLINDKAVFTRGHVLQVRNGRFEPHCNDPAIEPRLVFANPTMLGRFLCHVAGRAEMLDTRPAPADAPAAPGIP
jgi:hypothetical protein